MSRVDSQGPEVHETDYLDADLGPPEDTDVFYQGTPPPTERSQVAPRPTNQSSAAPRRLAHSSSSTPGPTNDGAERTLPLVPLLAGVSFMGFAVLVVLVGWWAMGPAELDVPDRTDHTTEEPEDATWEGVKVKKGLR